MLWWRLKNFSNSSGRLVLRLVKMSSTKHLYNVGLLGEKVAPLSSFVITMSRKTSGIGSLTVQPSASL